jgi:hypothetical protein
MQEHAMSADKHPSFEHTRPQRRETATTGKGMPARVPQDGEARVGKPLTPKDAADEASLALPHERDQSTDMTPAKPDPTIRQAGRDLDRGLKDTSKGPEMDRAYTGLKQSPPDK